MKKKILVLIAVFSMMILPAVSAKEGENVSNFIDNVVSTFGKDGGDISFTLKQDLNLENLDLFGVDVTILKQAEQNAPAFPSYEQNYAYTVYRAGKEVQTKVLKAGDKISIKGIFVYGDTSNTWQKEVTTQARITVGKNGQTGEHITLSFNSNGIERMDELASQAMILKQATNYMFEKYADKKFYGIGGGVGDDGSSITTYEYIEELTKNANAVHSVDIKVSSNSTLKQVQDDIDAQMKKSTVSLQLKDNSNQINSEILKAIQNKKYIATVAKYSENGGYIWTFDGTKIKTTDFNIDLSLNIGSSKHQDVIKNLIPKDRQLPLYLEFSYHGALPEGTKVRVSNKQYNEGDYLTLYYYNENTKQLEEVAKNLKVDQGKGVQFTLEHCSEYVLVKQQSFIKDSSNDEVKDPSTSDKEEIKDPSTSDKEETKDPSTSDKEETKDPSTSDKEEIKDPSTSDKEEIKDPSTPDKEETKVDNAPSNAQTSSMNIALYIVLAIASLVGIIWILISNKKKIA